MGPGHPFPDDIGENEIEQATLVDQLSPTQTGRQYRAGSETWSVAWSPDGTYFAWSCGGRKVRLVPWNRYKHHIEHNDSLMIEGQHVRCIDTGELVWAVAFGCGTAATTPNSINLNWWRYKVPKDLILATGLNSGRIRTWNVRTGELMLELIDHKDVIRDLKFAPNGTMSLASVSRDGTLKLWELNDDGNMRKTLQGTSKWIYSCEWSPDAKMMVTTGDSRSALLWDMVKLQRLGKLDGHHHDVCSCDFSPDGALLATASYDTKVVVWDPHTCTKLLELWHLYPPPSPIYAGGANGSYVRGVSFCHDGRHIASVADDGYVRFWDLFNSTTAPVQIALVNNAICCGYSPDGAVLAVGTRNGSVTFWLSPMQVPSLQHICRMAIRRLVPSTKLDSLHLPSRIKSFLKYQDPSVQKMPIPTGRPESISP